LGLWLLAWIFIFADHRRFRLRSALTMSAALLVAAAAGVVATRYDRAVGIVLADAPMRLSPHGRAPEVSNLTAAQSVRLERQQGGWWLVNAAGKSGWLPAPMVARIDE
jgi:uncharacterized protein YraI